MKINLLGDVKKLKTDHFLAGKSPVLFSRETGSHLVNAFFYIKCGDFYDVTIRRVLAGSV